jgi:glucose dehydrogenase
VIPPSKRSSLGAVSAFMVYYFVYLFTSTWSLWECQHIYWSLTCPH